MTFFPSTVPDISESIPMPLTGGGATATLFAQDRQFDVMVNGLPFMFRINNNFPYQRAGGQVRKQQLDTSTEAGEQSLSDWWFRSQTSWHMGAGIKFYEPGSLEETQYRFDTSQGVDVWTEGQLSLLNDMDDVAAGLAEPVYLTTHRRAGADGFVSASGTALAWRDDAGASVITATLPAGNATQPAAQGGTAWVGHTNGVSKWDTAGAGTLTTPWTCTGVAKAWWVKSRLFIAVGPKIWWVDHTVAGPSVVETSLDATLVATNADPDWVWTDVSETADSILLAGNAAAESAVFAVGIDDSVPVPVLTAARQVAQLPPGERILCMGAYLSTYIVVGTTLGVRVGVVGQNGSVTLGPITVEADEPVTDVTFYDRFAYLPVSRMLPDGTSGAVRIDLSAQIGDSGVWAWNWDVSTRGTFTATSICKAGSSAKIVVAAGSHIFVESDSLLPSGWLDSGLIRYQTAELKDFQRARVTGQLNNGTVTLSALVSGNEYSIITYGPSTGLDDETAINLLGGPLFAALAFKVTLVRDGTTSPVVDGLTVKAIPSVKKSRLHRYPLSCFDWESSKYGEKVGYERFAWDRLEELEALEDAGAAVQIVDTRANEYVVGTIESLEFMGNNSPDGSKANSGGVLNLTIRVR